MTRHAHVLIAHIMGASYWGRSLGPKMMPKFSSPEFSKSPNLTRDLVEDKAAGLVASSRPYLAFEKEEVAERDRIIVIIMPEGNAASSTSALPIVAVDLDECLGKFVPPLAEFHNEAYGTSLQLKDFHSYHFCQVGSGSEMLRGLN